MSTADSREIVLFQVHNYSLEPAITVYLPHNLSHAEFHSLLPISLSAQRPAFTFPALHNWLTRLYSNLLLQDDPAHPFHKRPYRLRALDIQAVDWFWRNIPNKEDKLGFMKLQATVTTDPYVHEGDKGEKRDGLPGAVFLRGGSVGILVSIQTLRSTNLHHCTGEEQS
jgi:ADP-sugar diphosphatase